MSMVEMLPNLLPNLRGFFGSSRGLADARTAEIAGISARLGPIGLG
jgi:hypothetical protein